MAAIANNYDIMQFVPTDNNGTGVTWTSIADTSAPNVETHQTYLDVNHFEDVWGKYKEAARAGPVPRDIQLDLTNTLYKIKADTELDAKAGAVKADMGPELEAMLQQIPDPLTQQVPVTPPLT